MISHGFVRQSKRALIVRMYGILRLQLFEVKHSIATVRKHLKNSYSKCSVHQHSKVLLLLCVTVTAVTVLVKVSQLVLCQALIA